MSYVDYSKEALMTLKADIDKRQDEIGKAIISKAKADVPVDTGNLKRSLYYKILDDGTLRVGDSADYALFVELGTRKAKAQPYLLDNTIRTVKEIN